uniref:Pentatricopeptide repeat-containing protein n=1 Tax=Kalanchoe fedtschenkoi TaxID=63787 RepID=A0A7N0RH55_KALFE
MFRNLSRIHLRWSLDPLFIAKANKLGCEKAGVQLEILKTFTTSNVKEESTIRLLVCGIVNALHLGDRSKASSMLLGLAGTNSMLKAHDFERILELCARYNDPLFAMETWRVLEDKQTNANAFDLLSTAGDNYELTLLPIYNDFLNTCVDFKNLHYANQCLNIMEMQAVGKNEVTYIVLLKLAVLQKDLFAVHEIWEEYIKYYNPTIISLWRFIWAFASLKDLKSSCEKLQHMVMLASENIMQIKVSDKGKLRLARPDIPIPLRKKPPLEAPLVKNHKSSDSSHVDSGNINSKTPSFEFCHISKWVSCHGSVDGKITNTHAKTILCRSFAHVIFACVYSEDSKFAKELMFQMKSLGLEPSKSTYDAFIQAVSLGGGYKDGLKVLKEMRNKNMEPCESSLASLSISCSKALQLNFAEALLYMVSGRVGVLPFNSFLRACAALDKPELAKRMLSRMKKMQVQLDMRTYELLFALFGNVNTPYEEWSRVSQEETAKRIRVIELDMARNGFQHNFTSMRNLLNALGAEGMKRELVEYWHVAEKLCDTNDLRHAATLHNIVLHSLVEFEESTVAIKIFKNMRARGYPPDAGTYTIMIECCSLTGCCRSAMQLLSLMLRDGFFPTAVTYTALMKVVKGYENFNEEMYLLYQASSNDCDPSEKCYPDAVMYNTILLKARDKGRIDVIEFLVEKMHQEKIQPNPVTCSIVLDTYADQGYNNTALEALQVMSLRMISEDKEELHKRQPEFEELILSQSPEAESQILDLFNSEEEVATALLNLRWCSLIGFTTPWSPEESSWAKSLSANFKRNLEESVSQ